MTLQDIKRRIMNGVPVETFEDGTIIEDYIDSAQTAIETFLDMPLEATSYRQYFDKRDTTELTGIGDTIMAGKTPVISSDNQHGKDWIAVSDDLGYVDYVAGFSLIPADIEQVLFNLSMYEINRATGNTYNLSTKTVVTGQATVNISKAPADFYRDELKRLEKYRNYYHPVVYAIQP